MTTGTGAPHALGEGGTGHSERTRVLLSIVDRLPVRTRERARLITAFGLAESEAWMRVELELAPERLDALAWADQLATPYDLAHVLETASTVAELYDSGPVTPAHIAVALVVTSRATDLPGTVGIVSRAFGLGELERPEEILNHHLRRREEQLSHDVEDSIEVGWTPSWHWLTRVAPIVDPLLRVAGAVALGVLATTDGTWLSWVLAVAALVPTRDPRLPRTTSDDRLPVGVLSRWPLPLALAMIASLASLWDSALALLLLFLVTEAAALTLEWAQARTRVLGGAGVGRHGQARPFVLRVLQYPDLYALRLRAVILIAPLPVLALPALIVSSVSVIWIPLTVVALFTARATTGAALLSAAALLPLVDGNPQLPLTGVALGLVGRLLIASERRIPAAPLPVPVDRVGSPRRALEMLSARRLLRRGRQMAALDLITRGRPLDSDRQDLPLLLAWALLQSGRPGDALRVADAFAPGTAAYAALVRGTALLDLGRLDEAVGAMSAPRPAARGALHRDLVLLIFRIEIAAGAREGLVGTILSSVPPRIRAYNFTVTAVLLRLAAEAAAITDPLLATRIAASAFGLTYLERRAGEGREYDLVDAGRPTDLEHFRMTLRLPAGTVRASAGLDAEEIETRRTFAEILLRSGHFLEAAEALDSLADDLEPHVHHRAAALDVRIEAVAALNSARHGMIDQEIRRRWWARSEASLGSALAQAARGADWASVAELIEAGRLQADPHRPASTGQAADDVPFTRVRGVSRLEESAGHRVRRRPPSYDLEDAAAAVLGEGAWWFSSWVADDVLFWALVRPGRAVEGGAEALAPLAPILASLREALPQRYDGEGAEDADERMLDSPLFGAPSLASEREFAARLGRLVPAAVARALREAPTTVRLAIAPSREFAEVPWASLLLPGETDVRLIEKAEIALAPPLELIAAIGRRGAGPATASAALPISGAVIDPGGDLPRAAALAALLPAEAAVLTSVDAPDADDVAALLGALPRDSAFLFAGHTGARDAGDARAALSLAPQDRDGPTARSLLVTADDLAAPDTRFSLPREILLLACGSSDLHRAERGEWTTLGPALLRAGADRAIVTAFPIVDDADMEAELVTGDRRGSPVAHLRTLQLERLHRWRSSAEEDCSPGLWAGHIGLGAFGAGTALRPRPLGTDRRWASDGIVDLVEVAASMASRRGAGDVTLADLWIAAGLWGWTEGLRPWRARLCLAVSYALAVPAMARQWRESRTGSAPVRVGLDDDVRATLRAAADLAASLHHRVIAQEHVLGALLRRSDAPGFVARTLSGFDARQAEVATTLFEGIHPGWQSTGRTPTVFLRDDAVAELYASIDVALPPQQVDRWYWTDR